MTSLQQVHLTSWFQYQNGDWIPNHSEESRNLKALEGAINAKVGFGGTMQLPVFSDSTRPDAAKCQGCVIYNTTDSGLNWSDGTNWKLLDGSVT